MRTINYRNSKNLSEDLKVFVRTFLNGKHDLREVNHNINQVLMSEKYEDKEKQTKLKFLLANGSFEYEGED